MKTSHQFAALCLWMTLSTLAAQPTPLNDATSDESAPYVITERGLNSQLLQRVTWSTNTENEVTVTTNFVTQIETGLSYQDPNSGEWLPSEEVIELLPGGTGAVARKAPYTVVFPPSLYNGVIELTTPDGTILRSRPTLLSFFDGQTSILLADLKDSTGYLLPSSNQVIYPDAFSDGINADVILTFTKSGFEADVVFRSPLPEGPEDFGLRPDTCRLQLLTEFFDTEPPEKESETISSRDGLADSILRFGSMRMVKGKGFLVGTAAQNETPVQVFKSWQVLEGRSFLVEEIPWRKIEPQLNLLAAASTPRVQNLAATGSNLRQASTHRLLPPRRLVQSTTNTIQLAKADFGPSPGFVLDYTILSSTNTLLKADTTYFVSGTVGINNLVIEGGTILKFTNTSSAKITVTGTIDCQTGPYRPAVFTHYLDGSVGETIATGTITNYYGMALEINVSSNTLHDLRFSYATSAVSLAFSPGQINLANVQFVKCQYPIDSSVNDQNTIIVDNSLFYAAKYGIKGGRDLIVRGQHLTANQCDTFAWSQNGGDSYAYLTNCLFVVTNLGSDFTFSTNSTAHYATDPGGVFQTVGSGSHYLSSTSTNREAGTTNISASLLADLKKKTTHPPVEITTNFSSTTTLGIQAARDTDTPDRGYNYDPIDFVMNGRSLTNVTLVVTNGAVIGNYGTSSSYGIQVASGGKILSTGTPALPNWFVRYNTVQEQATTNWSAGSVAPAIKVAVDSAQAQFRFTGWSVLGGSGDHFNATIIATNAPWFTDCQFAGGTFTMTPCSVGLTNCLWERVSLTLRDEGYDTAWYLYNNLVRGGKLTYKMEGSSPVGVAKDNLFDQTTIFKQSGSDNFTHGYNGYVTNQNRLTPNGTGDVILTNAPVYQTNWLGKYYYPTTDGMLSLLLNIGSRNATNAGLYHYTVTTNQMKETNSTVDIGFHSVTVDDHQQTFDIDGDGVADHSEDRNGNGAVDSDETDWRSGSMVVGWGDNTYGQATVPAGLRDILAVAGGQKHSLALKMDGTVIAWGGNLLGETNVPADLTNVVAIAANGYAETTTPTAQSLALKRDGTVVQWGTTLANPPADLTNAANFSAGAFHSLAVRSNATVAVWGDLEEPAAQVPTNLAPMKAVAAAWNHSVALQSNGTVVAWGHNFLDGQTNVPPGLTNATAVAASALHSLALRNDGTVVAWGYNPDGQTNVPSGLTNVVAVAAGGMHSLALRSDGTVSKWGGGESVPAGLDGVTTISAGYQHSLAVRSGLLTPLLLQQPSDQAALAGSSVTFTASVIGLAVIYYQWQFNSNNIAGATNTTLTLNNVQTNNDGSYRFIVSNGAGSITSSNANFYLVTPPIIISQSMPTNQTVIFQTNVTLNVVATAPGQFNGFPLGYQWLFNGTNIAGATTSSYNFTANADSSGTYSVTVTNAAGSTSAVWQVTMTYVGSYIDVGTLAYHLSTNAVGYASGYSGSFNDELEMSGWSYADYYPTNLHFLTNAVWSTNFWLKGAQGLSATAIGFLNGRGGQGLVTMVSPRHYLCATHMTNYFSAAFLDTNNIIYWRTNLQWVDITDDTSVGILNADLPSSVGYLQVGPTNLSNYLPTNNVSVVQGIGMNQDMRLFSQPVTFTNLVYWKSSGVIPFGLGTNWSVDIRGGDSSDPERLLINNRLVLVSHNTGVVGGPNYALQFAAINQQMHYLSTNNNVGTDYQLTSFSLTNWPTIH